jgi:plastocyanin
VRDLVKMHVVSLKDVVDAQANRDQKLAYQKIRDAAHHMQMIADPLAEAISAQFPEKFPAMYGREGGLAPARHQSMNTIWSLGLAALTGLAIGPQAQATETTAATIKLFQFQPKTLEVKAGATVAWTNGDDIEHSVTAGAPGKEADDFNSGFFGKGESFSFTFSEPGTYSYFCKRHPSMKGQVKVSD